MSYIFFPAAGKSKQALEKSMVPFPFTAPEQSIFHPCMVPTISSALGHFSCQFPIKTFSFNLFQHPNNYMNAHRLHKLKWITVDTFISHVWLWNKTNAKQVLIWRYIISPIIRAEVTPLSWTLCVIFLPVTSSDPGVNTVLSLITWFHNILIVLRNNTCT